MWISGLVLLAALTIGVFAVQFVSARTAENGCADEAERRGFSNISDYSWSWSPLGTKCIFDGRASETRLFW